MKSYQVFAPEGIPAIRPGDDLADCLLGGLERERFPLQAGDILVLAHKIVSRAEGRLFPLRSVRPSPRALVLGERTGKPAELVELILRESSEVLWAAENGLLLCRHRLGFVCANAAVDCSNAGDGSAALLPENPDASAAALRQNLEARLGLRLGVVICDTHGKPFREGACGTVIGASGVQLLKSYVGRPDLDGRIIHSSVEAAGDELACAATLLMGQSGEGRPLAVVRGLDALGEDTAAALLRPTAQDVFLSALLNWKGGSQW